MYAAVLFQIILPPPFFNSSQSLLVVPVGGVRLPPSTGVLTMEIPIGSLPPNVVPGSLTYRICGITVECALVHHSTVETGVQIRMKLY